MEDNPALGAEAPRFDHPVRVVEGDIDANGHANNVAYLRWVQDAAVAHWFAAVAPDLAAAITWAVVRHEIDYRRPALLGDALVARTWVGAMTAATCERFCRVIRPRDGQILAQSRTTWCVFDPATGRPRRIDPRLRAAFGAAGPKP